MRKTVLLLSLAALLFGTASAHAAHLTCNNSSNIPNADLVAFDLTISVPVSSGGGGGGAGKATTTVSVTLPVDANLPQLSQIVTSGRHSSTCVITDSTSSLELTLHDVTFSKLEVVSGPTSTGKTQSVVQLSLAFSSIATTSLP